MIETFFTIYGMIAFYMFVFYPILSIIVEKKFNIVLV
jgi:hypothetical protein